MDPRLRPIYGRTAARLSVAEEMPAGAALHRELERLSREPLDAGSAVRLHALWAKLEAHIAAQKMLAVADAVFGVRDQLLQPASVDEAEMLAAQEIACATRVSYPTARNQVALVHRIGQSLPACWEAMDHGELSFPHVKAIERATENCSPRIAEMVSARVVPLAIERGWTAAETGKHARKLVIALDPEGAADRAKEAKDAADVSYYPQPDEVADLQAHGDALELRKVFDALNDAAEAMARAGDGRPVGVRRFAALVDAVLGAPEGQVARRSGEVLAMGQISTLLGLDELPGEVVGYGPVSADTLRRMAADHRLRRLLTDPLTGAVVDLGRRSYAPSTRLRKAVQAVHPTCTMPGCGRPAVHCEVDHRKEYDRTDDPGRTDQCNLRPLCKMHHDLKTRKRWRVDQNPDGSTAVAHRRAVRGDGARHRRPRRLRHQLPRMVRPLLRRSPRHRSRRVTRRAAACVPEPPTLTSASPNR